MCRLAGGMPSALPVFFLRFLSPTIAFVDVPTLSQGRAESFESFLKSSTVLENYNGPHGDLQK